MKTKKPTLEEFIPMLKAAGWTPTYDAQWENIEKLYRTIWPTNFDEVTLGVGDGSGDLYVYGSYEAVKRVQSMILELQRLRERVNSPEIEEFLRGTHLEAIHQVERWGEADDRAKRPADWFWLVGYLAGKALHSEVSANREKALHHCISTAAALYNWHCAIKGTDVRMSPGSSDVAKIVEAAFPGEAS